MLDEVEYDEPVRELTPDHYEIPLDEYNQVS